MCKPNQESLEVNNSSNQTGLAHQTSLDNQLFIEEAIQTAVRLQRHISGLFKVDFVKDLYIDEVVDADQCIHKITDTLSDILGRAYVERVMSEGV